MSGGPSRVPRWIRMILRVPLFYKILLANIAIVVAGAVAGTWLTVKVARGNPVLSPSELVIVFAGLGAVVSAVVNGLILHFALGPLRSLERTARRIREGEQEARVSPSPLADRQLERLTSTFNEMLDTLGRYRHRLRAVAERATASAERERKRIARELHDDTAQRIATLQLRVQMLRKADSPALLEQGLAEVAGELRRANEGVRRMARGLRPPALDELGLVSAVRGFARIQSEAYETSVEVEGTPDPRLGQEVALAVYRIVQEAVSNALRHARADRVRIRFEETAEELRVTVEDDGRGFVPGKVMTADGRGLGLSGMKERASYVGGRVWIASEEGRGTRIHVTVPRHRGHGAARGP